MLNLKEEARFAELKYKCRELKVMAPPDVFITLKVRDKNGVLVFDDTQRGHSWTRNFYNIFHTFPASFTPTGSTYGAGYLSSKQTGGTVTNPTLSGAAVHMKGLVNNAAYGIVAGTGNTAFSVEQNALAAIVGHGSGTGQLVYAADATPAAVYTSGTKSWVATLSRVLNNNSGGSITIKETGLYGRESSASTNFMLERSVLDPTVDVANGAQLKVTYEISMDFSAID